MARSSSLAFQGSLCGRLRAVLAVGGAALAPLADGLGADAEALGQHAGGLGERAISARTAGVVRALGWMASISASSGPRWAPRAVKAPGMLLNRPTRLIPTTFRHQTAR